MTEPKLDIRGAILRHRDRRSLHNITDNDERIARWMNTELNLRDGLRHVDDAQLARVVLEFVTPNVDGTSDVILTEVRERLERAQGGPMSEEEIDKALAEGPPCQQCGEESTYKPPLPPEDRPYYECSSLTCGHRNYL